MDIFFRFLFGHLLADFTFQTNYIAEWKRRSSWGLLAHVAIHPLCYMVALGPFLVQSWRTGLGFSAPAWVCILIAACIHWLEDWVRVGLINKGWPDNTVFYLWDQLLHIAVLWLLSPTHTQEVHTKLFMLGSLFVMVTHCATVTVWFIEKDIFGSDYPETEEKYISMMQRLVLWLAFFLPHPWWIFVILFVVVTYGRHVWARKIDYTWTSVILGQTMAIVCGIISRFALGFHF